MARTRNISIGVSAALHARYADLGMNARRAVLAEIRQFLERRLVAGWSATETDLADCPVRVRALGVCRALVVESENGAQRGQFLPDLQTHSPAMGQKDGKKWTAAPHLQPTIPKPDRPLEPKGHEGQGAGFARGTAEDDQSVTLPNGW